MQTTSLLMEFEEPMDKSAKIYISGHKGMCGSAVLRLLEEEGFDNLLTASSRDLDLRCQAEVAAFFAEHQPDYVIMAAAKVGGIAHNIRAPAHFIYDNLMIQSNVIHCSHLGAVKKLLFLGSSCIYPRSCPQPMKEEYLLTGELEPTNESYALAKIAGLKMIESYRRQYGFNGISVMPCNLYGPNDSFDLEHSHVLSALVRRFVDAKNAGVTDLTLWGSGLARREFMHVDDAARALLFLMEKYDAENFINIGWGTDISIRDLSELVSDRVGYAGNIHWDQSKPDGMPKKCMDVTRMRRIGFGPEIALEQGVEEMIAIYKNKVGCN